MKEEEQVEVADIEAPLNPEDWAGDWRYSEPPVQQGIDLASEPDVTTVLAQTVEDGKVVMNDLVAAMAPDPFGHGPCKQPDCDQPALLPGGECARHTAEHTVLTEAQALERDEAIRQMAESMGPIKETAAKAAANLAALHAVTRRVPSRHAGGYIQPKTTTAESRRKMARASRKRNRR
jgi:hypothetical protein